MEQSVVPSHSKHKKLWMISILILIPFLPLLISACTGQRGPEGPQGPLPFGVDRQINLSVSVSKPNNGTRFIAGEQPVLTITLEDQTGKSFNRNDDFSQLRLMVSGPTETADTTTAVLLLNTSADRSQTVHHYVDLTTNPDVQVEGSTLIYKLQPVDPVSNEMPGTYTVSIWAVSKTSPIEQAMAIADFQIGTAVIEIPIVSPDKCATCHLGADNGKFYFHHIDPGQPGQTGNWALDQAPVAGCKTCHNNEGYAAYRSPTDNNTRIPDPIVFRVHGIHMGEGLENPINTDPNTGLFKDYTGVVFPADVVNCTRCHSDDRWKTKPSRLACGSCHDNVWFGDSSTKPETAEAHQGGPQANDSSCVSCHTADAGGVAPVSVAHNSAISTEHDDVDLTMSPSNNGKFYVSGEKPVISVVIKNAEGQPIDHTQVDTLMKTVNLYVYGPRSNAVPVLTTSAAKNAVVSTVSNSLLANNDPAVTVSSEKISYQLSDVAGLSAGTYMAYVYTNSANITTDLGFPRAAFGIVTFQVGTEIIEPKIAENCTQCHGNTVMHLNESHVHPGLFDTDYCLACHDYGHPGEGDLFTQVGGNSTTGWAGYGAKPLSARVHGVHAGAYLNHPEYVYGGNATAFSEVIFPQDLRNCTVCHDAKTSGSWETQPNRLACTACHDNDADFAHTNLMTQNFILSDPYAAGTLPTCIVCHSAGKSSGVDIVHDISSPYVPPYTREGFKIP